MTPDPLRMKQTDNCAVAACGRSGQIQGLCVAHWSRRYKAGIDGRRADMDSPVKPRNPVGRKVGSRVKQHGYTLIFEPTHPNANSTGYVHEHRKTMAECLGRSLYPHEEVRRKNGVRDDNRLVHGHELYCPSNCCNLELWSRSQPAGQRVRDKVAWAREILRMYGDVEEDDAPP